MSKKNQKYKILILVLIVGVLGSVLVNKLVMPSRWASAATLTGASLNLGDSRPSQASVAYTFDADNVTTSAIKCISVQFSTAITAGSVPSGFDSTGAALSASSDYIPTPASWTVDASVNGTVEVTYGTGETPAGASDRTVILTGITNGSTANTTYYGLFRTYNNTDCSSSAVDTVNVAFIYTNGQTVSLTVDPSLTFSIAAVNSSQNVNGATTSVTSTTTTVPFGTVTTSANAIAAHDLSISTNAQSGYTVYIRDTQPPTSGSNEIDDHSGSNASPSTFSSAGTEAFGYTTNDTSLGTGTTDRFTSSGGNKWAAATTTNAEVAYSATASASDTIRVGYQVGIAGNTPAGTYTSSVILTAVPIY